MGLCALHHFVGKEREIFPDEGFPQKLLQERQKENRRNGKETNDIA